VAFRRFTDKTGEEIRMTEQSLSEARDKIKWEAFRELSQTIGKFAYTGEYDRWNGYRVWGIDGTKFALPNYPEIAEYWGAEKGSPNELLLVPSEDGTSRSSLMARGSILYDVINYTVFDAQIEPLSADERS